MRLKQELEELLLHYGYDPNHAEALHAEGMGPLELEQRLKTTPGSIGTLEYTHNIQRMTRAEVITRLKECEKRIAELNDAYQFHNGPRPSEADPTACARRKELRKMLVEQLYR